MFGLQEEGVYAYRRPLVGARYTDIWYVGAMVPVERLDELHLTNELACSESAQNLACAVSLACHHFALHDQQQVRH